jgi:hypothetical protein
VTTRYVAASVAVTVIVVLAVWLTNLSFQRAILLAPVLVIGVAAVAGLFVFWGRVGWDSLQRAQRPRLVLAAAAVIVAVLVVMSVLGVNLPHE